MTPNNITTIYFDVGRTLRKTVPALEKQPYWLDKILSLTGMQWSPEELSTELTSRLKEYKTWGNQSLIELADFELWRTWLLPEAVNQITHINAPLLTRYSRRAIGDGVLLPHAAKVIQSLFNRGYRLGVISNTVSSEQTPDFLAEMNLDNYFELVLLSCNIGIRKPDPAIFFEATRHMGVDPKNCAYVGDQVDRDILGSQNAGFPVSVLIDHLDSPTGDPKLNLPKPTHTINSLTELLDIFPPLYRFHPYLEVNGTKETNLQVWNISLSTMWSHEKKIDIIDLPNLLPQMGFSGVELNHSIKMSHLAGLDLGSIPITSIHEPCPADVSTSTLTKKDWLISAEDEDNRQQGVRMVMRSIDLAANIGVKLLIVHPGTSGVSNRLENKLRKLFGTGQTDSEEYQELFHAIKQARNANLQARINATTKSLKELINYAAPAGIKLSLENRYHFMDVPTIPEMEHFLNLGDDSLIGMQFDIGHAVVMDKMGFIPMMEWLEKFGPRISGVHLHDVKGLEDHFAPGLGDIDFKAVSKFIPASTVRTLEVRGNNSEADIRRGLEILHRAGILELTN